MNRITEITKRDILDLFQNGLEIDEFFQTRTVTYNYYGRLEEIDFLKRLYDLERMPSFDSRFANAEQDIWQHTVNNDDYPYCWVFEDKPSSDSCKCKLNRVPEFLHNVCPPLNFGYEKSTSS